MTDIGKKYQEALQLQEEIAFLDPSDGGWEEKVKSRNTILWEICQDLLTPTSLQGNGVFYLGSILLLMNEWRQDQPGTFFIPAVNGTICEEIESNKDRIEEFHFDQILKMQQKIVQKAWEEEELKHKSRKQALERAIKYLLSIEIESLKMPAALLTKIKLTLARAYLYRGMIIRPKGFSVPAKKKEALDKALEKLVAIDASKDEEFLRLKGMVYLEKERIREVPKNFKDIIFDILDSMKSLDYSRSEDVQIILRHAELLPDYPFYVEEILNSDKTEIFDKARAAYILNNGKMGNLVNQAICSLEEEEHDFSQPYWEKLVDLLKVMLERKHPKAQENALLAWDICKKRELMVSNNCILRWYWAQQRELYDLAFRAAESPDKMAQIADSLKGRPALRWSDLEKLARDDESVKARLEDEARGLRGYVKRRSSKRKPVITAEEPLIEFPAPWIAIHFYIDHGQIESGSKAHAMIYDANTKKWRSEEFKVHDLWKAYWVWQENYARVKEGAAVGLKKLCMAIGEAMPFLFSLMDERPVAFVPYGFLHRVPLHMAIRADKGKETVWAVDHPSTFLSSWSSFRLPKPSARKDSFRIILEHFPDYTYSNYSGWEKISSKAEMEGTTKPVEKLIVRCHGVAHSTNPFASSLKLSDGQWSHQEILGSKLNITGAQVFLGACETDLVPAMGTPVDEHLSISNAFIQRGAAEVLGGLWRMKSVLIEDLCTKIFGTPTGHGEPLWNLLWKWHCDCPNLKVYDPVRPVDLYEYAPFRTIGLPLTLSGKN